MQDDALALNASQSSVQYHVEVPLATAAREQGVDDGAQSTAQLATHRSASSFESDASRLLHAAEFALSSYDSLDGEA